MSPNQAFIRTERGENRWNESEFRCSFGQEEEKIRGMSPNQAFIRTGRGENQGNESESGVHSDRKRRKSEK